MTPGTYSYYKKEYNGPTTMVQAAGQGDFIGGMEIVYVGDAPYLKLTQADNMDYAPVIFFSIEGPLKEYILHIDPVSLKGEMMIPIVPNVNLAQAISLIFDSKWIEGRIKIKHLNEFINKPLDFKISKKYLLERYFLNKRPSKLAMTSLSSGEKAEMEELVANMISYTSPYMDWDKVSWQEADNSMQRSQSKTLPIGKANVSSNQRSIIDLIAPDLLKYNEKIYSIMEVLVKDLNNQIDENNSLKMEKQELMDEVKDLEKTVAELKDKTNNLEIHNDELNRDIVKLKNNNDELYDEIKDLESDSSSLYRKIKDLEMDNVELYNVRRDFGISDGGLYNHIKYLEDKSRERNTINLPIESEKTEESLETVEE